jgi:hypothetical protein
LNDARRMIDNQQRNSLADELKQLRESAEQLAQQQKRIQDGLEQLKQDSSQNGNSSAQQNSSGQANAADPRLKQFQKARQILQDKTELNKGLNGMEQSIFSSARKAASQQKPASQQLQAAGNSMRDNRIQDKVTQSGQLIARGMLDIADQREKNIQGMIEDLKDKIAGAEKKLDSSSSGSDSPEERLSKALTQTGDLVENLESFRQRLKEMRRQGKGSQKGLQQAEGGDKNGARQSDSGAQAQQQEGDGRQPGEQANSQNQTGTSSPKPGGDEGRSGQAKNGQNPGAQAQASGQTSKEGSNSSSRSAQANSNSNSAARGANSPQGENRQNDFSEGDRQYYGNYRGGNAAVNFGDYQLATPRFLNPEQARQFEREYDVRLKEAQELAKGLRDRQDLARQVQDMVERMKQMKSRFQADEQELERLHGSVVEGFRQLELDLSKNLQQLISRENLHLAKDEEVPEAYRQQVEDYYKALSKK